MKRKRFFETGFRLKREEKERLRKQGLHVYDRRDNGRESTIEPSVAVDFLGTIITNFPVKFKKTGPTAYVIYQGDTYLKNAGATRVYGIADLKGAKTQKKGKTKNVRKKLSAEIHHKKGKKPHSG